METCYNKIYKTGKSRLNLSNLMFNIEILNQFNIWLKRSIIQSKCQRNLDGGLKRVLDTKSIFLNLSVSKEIRVFGSSPTLRIFI